MNLDEIFDNPAQSELARSHFTTLQKHEGWILLKRMTEHNIELLKESIIDGTAGETKEEIDRVRDKLKVLRELINKPQEMIEKLAPAKEINKDNPDPFDTVESLAEKRLKDN